MTTEPFPPLETARLHLRCVMAQDAAATAALMTPEVSRWVASWPIPFTQEMAAARIEAARALAFAGDALPLAVVEKISDTLLGWAMLYRDTDDHHRGSFGYWLGERHHGKGYMRELAPVVVAAGFARLGLTIIEAGAQPANEASFAVMRSCGMIFSRSEMVHAPARQRDELCDIYEVRRPNSI
jgi:ribosomal-protein-alanine N-acetyltransferase